MPITTEGPYLQAGWIKSTDGIGFLGRRWAGDAVQESDRYSYAASSVSTEDWHQYAGLVQPPLGATDFQAWLLNWESAGKVYFDNVLFVEIGLPEE
jgi:hypothetical protein